MKEIITLGITVGRTYSGDWLSITRETLKPLKPLEEKKRNRGYDYIFDYYPIDIELARAFLKTQQIDSAISVERRYTDEELLAAPYLYLGYDDVEVYAQEGKPLRRFEPRPLVCDRCEFYESKRDLASAEVDDDGDGYRLTILDWVLTVVTHSLAKQLQAEKFTGLELLPVGRGDSPTWYSLSSNNVLPPIQHPPAILTTSAYRTDHCLLNHGFGHSRTELYYSAKTFNAQDFNCTWEYFGERTGGHRLLIISTRVYRKLVELGVPELKCEPIRFIDELNN